MSVRAHDDIPYPETALTRGSIFGKAFKSEKCECVRRWINIRRTSVAKLLECEDMRTGVWTIGIDEVGRGALAGPLTVAAYATLHEKADVQQFFPKTLRDSKKLSKVKRNNIHLSVRKNRKLNMCVYAIASVSNTYVDKHGLTRATSYASHMCLKGLQKQGVDISRALIQVDAGIKLITQEIQGYTNYIKGDENYVCIALASIMAKVSRDRYMTRLDARYPGYAFSAHVGYGTAFHRRSIKNKGILPVHRTTFIKK